MGYDHWVVGKLIIKPAIPESELQANGLDDAADSESDLACQNVGDPDTVGLVDGEITVIQGNSWTEAKWRWEERTNASALQEAVQTLADLAKIHGCTVEGALYASGDDHPDLSRLRVENYKVIEEAPEYLWPNGDQGWGS